MKRLVLAVTLSAAVTSALAGVGTARAVSSGNSDVGNALAKACEVMQQHGLTHTALYKLLCQDP